VWIGTLTIGHGGTLGELLLVDMEQVKRLLKNDPKVVKDQIVKQSAIQTWLKMNWK